MASDYEHLSREELIALLQDRVEAGSDGGRRNAVRHSEERFRSLTAAAFEGIGISENGKVVEVNDQLMRMLGYTREEIIGRSVLDLVAPESRAAVLQAIRAAKEGPYEHLGLR